MPAIKHAQKRSMCPPLVGSTPVIASVPATKTGLPSIARRVQRSFLDLSHALTSRWRSQRLPSG